MIFFRGFTGDRISQSRISCKQNREAGVRISHHEGGEKLAEEAKALAPTGWKARRRLPYVVAGNIGMRCLNSNLG